MMFFIDSGYKVLYATKNTLIPYDFNVEYVYIRTH